MKEINISKFATLKQEGEIDLHRAFVFFFSGGTNCALNVQKRKEIILRGYVMLLKPRQIFNHLPLTYMPSLSN